MEKGIQRTAERDALIAGVSTFVVDAVIQFFTLRSKAPIPISVDSITNNVHTVLGASVGLGIFLAMLMTIINYSKIKGRKVPFFPKVFLLMIKHGFFTFGVLTALSVMWQRYVGTIEIGLLPAVFIIALIAGIVSATINYLTIRGCLLPERSSG
ncbi:MAG: hypothetical protein ABIQ75_09130 [Flavobacteriales bacterium]